MSNIAYVFVLGPEELEEQGLLLLESLTKNTEADKGDIFCYVTYEEKSDISKDSLQIAESKSTLLEGRIPNRDYPLSSAHAALAKAAKRTEKRFIALIDTDTVILDDFKIGESEKELFIKPEDLGNSMYWTRKESLGRWKDLYDKFNYEMPSRKIESTVDNKKMIPFYNGGVVIVNTNTDFPQKWLELSKEIYRETGDFFSEMIALAILTQEYNTEEISERYNYPLPLKTIIPEDTKLVHYHEYSALVKGATLNRNFRNEIQKFQESSLIKSFNSLSTHSKIALSLKDTYKNYIERRKVIKYNLVIPWIIPALEKLRAKKHVKATLSKIKGFS